MLLITAIQTNCGLGINVNWVDKNQALRKRFKGSTSVFSASR